LNFTPTDINLDSCWINYNGVNTSISCNNATINTDYFNYSINVNNVTVYANDTFGNLGSEIITWDYVLLNTAESYNENVFSSSLQDISINLTYDAGEYIEVTANLVWNGTNYTGTDSGVDGESIFNYLQYMPVVEADTNVSFYWDIFLNDGSTTTTISTVSHNQTINPLYAINITSSSCPAGFFEAVNFTFKDANNFTSLTDNIEYNFKYGIGNYDSYEIYGEFDDISDFRICINSSIENYKVGYGEIQFSKEGYSSRRFYLYQNQILSNSTTREYELLSLQNTDSTSFIFEVKNTFLNPYADKFISLLRWYPELNEYKVVETAITDTEGKTVMKVKTEDVDYRVGIYEQNGTLIKLADSVRMACLVDPCTYTLKIIHDPSDYYSIFDVESSLEFDEDNSRFIFIWNDPEQITSEMRLEVYKMAGNQDILICNDTSESYTGVMVCSIGNYTGDFYAKAYRSASPEKIFKTLFYTLRTGVESTFGLFLSVILALVTGLIGIFSPTIAIIMLIVGMLPALLFGAINLAIFMGIATLGGIVIHYIKKSR